MLCNNILYLLQLRWLALMMAMIYARKKCGSNPAPRINLPPPPGNPTATPSATNNTRNLFEAVGTLVTAIAQTWNITQNIQYSLTNLETDIFIADEPFDLSSYASQYAYIKASLALDVI